MKTLRYLWRRLFIRRWYVVRTRWPYPTEYATAFNQGWMRNRVVMDHSLTRKEAEYMAAAENWNELQKLKESE